MLDAASEVIVRVTLGQKRLAQERDSLRTRACAGRNTQNSVPGGLFTRAPEPEARPSDSKTPQSKL